MSSDEGLDAGVDHGAGRRPETPTPLNEREHPIENLLDGGYDDLEPGISPHERATGRFRILQIMLGVLLVAAGIAMLVFPGPGLVAIMVGLNMIKPDNAIVRWMRRKVPGIPEEGSVPRKYLFLGAGFLIAGTAFSILWGPAVTGWARELIGF